jgi:hypothetical protein
MSTIAQIPADLAERGRKLYQEKLKDILEPTEIGKFVAIEPDTGQYFVAVNDIDAILAGRAALPGKFFYLMRIGFRTAHKIGGAMYATGERPSHPFR